MRSHHVMSLLMRCDEQSRRVWTAGDCDQHSSTVAHQRRPANSKDQRFVRVGVSHGGAGWTRTSDNAIMSRALYHLSYGTAGRRRPHRAHPGEDPSAPPVPEPSACASWSGASPAPPASSCSLLSRRIRANALPNEKEPVGPAPGVASMVAEVGFEPTTFGL